ncbi:DUF3987 domain-containing protein [Desulfolutivibrio sulfoxidireducens]|uniref:DUF3987 domain-containing protein n=1 Tax=Desulfolutivibrio sulfoxidireducens TaxID=2773299 RepID=UPI00159E2452|nr:DUF3987 domain-containing protein [Desulfolutivibrio sulfoxidireducens]QLA16372.1 DUF3987 domain-containing protein [Desulfolutivibrio sulfoxidireducens]
MTINLNGAGPQGRAKSNTSAADPVRDFEAVLHEHGLVVDQVIPDGQLHRCGTAGKERGQDGAYVLHLDRPASGWWQNHRTGDQGTWTSTDGASLTPEDQAVLKARIKRDKAARQEAEARRYAEGRDKAKRIYGACPPCPADHPYLVRKHVQVVDGLRLAQDGRLVVPVLDENGQIQTLQFIGHVPGKDRDKDFLAGGQVAGGYFAIRGDDGPFFIVEGLATGLTVHEVTGGTVLAAFTAGNLKAVAVMAREKYPAREIILVADNDHKTDGNPGVTKATEAARAVKGKLAVPRFVDPSAGTDFNDLATAEGVEAVKAQLAEAREPEGEAVAPVCPPEPLRRDLPEAEPFPMHALGDVLGGAALVMAETIQAPGAICAQSVLAAAALAVQAYADVDIDGRVKPLSENFVSVAESGGRKSAVDCAALWPHRKYERGLVKTHGEEMADYLVKAAAHKKSREQALTKGKTYEERQALLKALGPEPDAPLAPVILTEDPTYEGLTKLLAVGQPSMGLFSDEGGRMIGGYGMSPENQLKTAAGLSGLWDGKPLDRVRALDGASKIYGRRVSMHLMAQPRVAELFLGNGLLDEQGLLARCLTVFPASTAGTRLYREADLAQSAPMRRYGARLLDILETPLPLADGERNELDPPRLKLAPDAKASWIRFHNYIEAHLGDGGAFAPIRAFANKAPEHAARLAGILTLVDDIRAKEIPLAKLVAGIELAKHYLAEALRLYHSGATDPDIELAERLLGWIQAQGRPHIWMTLIYQIGPNAIRDAKTAKRIIRVLEDHHWLEAIGGGMEIDGQFRRNVWRVRT